MQNKSQKSSFWVSIAIVILVIIATPSILLYFSVNSSNSLNEGMGKEEFLKNIDTYTKISECIEHDRDSHSSCVEQILPSSSDISAYLSNFRTGVCGGIFNGDFIEISKGVGVRKNNSYYYFLENKKQNHDILDNRVNELKDLGIIRLDNNWIMCTEDGSPRLKSF